MLSKRSLGNSDDMSSVAGGVNVSQRTNAKTSIIIEENADPQEGD